MAKKISMDPEEAARMCQVDVDRFLTDTMDKLSLTAEEMEAATTRVSAIKLDDPETQKILEIVVQADILETKNELTAIWIKGCFMQVAENVFAYRRVAGGVTGGIRGVLKALGWGKTQAYRARELVATFEDEMLEMPAGISAAKLTVLIERRKQDKKNKKGFDPVEWLGQNREALSDAKSSADVKKELGIVKAKKAAKQKTVETKVEPDPSVEEINVANISARLKRSEETGLNDAVLKSLSDMQVDNLKRWLNAQRILDEEGETVRPPDTPGPAPVQQESNDDEAPETFQYLVDRVAAATGERWAEKSPRSDIWNLFGWTKDLIDAAIDNWSDLELEETTQPPLPEIDFILEYSADVVKGAGRIILENSSKTIDGKKGAVALPNWEETVKGVVKDDGNIDLSNVYGEKTGRVGYVVPTYEGLSLNSNPIKVLNDDEFTVTSNGWLNVATPLFAAQPHCIALTMYDENGSFVVESRSTTGGTPETYWVKPAYARPSTQAQA